MAGTGTDEKKIATAALESENDKLRREEKARQGPPIWEELSSAKARPKVIPFGMRINDKVVDCYIKVKRLSDSEMNDWQYGGTESYYKDGGIQVMRSLENMPTKLFELSIIDYKIATEDMDKDGNPIFVTFAEEDDLARSKRYAEWLPTQADYFRTEILTFNGRSAVTGNADGAEK